MATATLIRPTAAASQADALADLPVANVRKPGDFPEQEFLNIRDVPVFAEHETVTRAGKPIKFGLDELSKIAERCNRRIETSGDYAAITIGHTPSPEDSAKGAPDPDVIGFAGPFRLGVMGHEDAAKRYAILADFHIYRDELKRLRKNPRRSPEVWLEDRFEEMFLDPIALLGAQAPRLDMGLLYSAHRAGGRQIEKYAAVLAGSPSATSVFIPGQVGEEKSHERYAEGDSGFSDAVPVQTEARQKRESEERPAMLEPQEVEQIVDAIARTPQWQFISQMMQERAAPGPGAMTPGADGAVGAEGETGPAPAGVGGERRSPPQAPSPPPAAAPSEPEKKKDAAEGSGSASEGAHADYPPAPRRFEAGSDEDDELDSELEEDEEAREREEYARMHAQYSKDEHVSRYAALHRKYAAGDAAGEYQEVPPGGSRDTINVPAGGAEVKKNAAGSADGRDVNKPAAGTADEGNNRPGEGSAGAPGGEGAEPYARRGVREQYASQTRVLRLERENRELQTRLADQERRNSNNERYARLQDLRQRYAFDLDSTFEQIKYGKANEEQFEGQCAFIEQNCREIPFGSYLPGSDDVPGAGPARGEAPGRGGATAEKYSRQASDQARAICEAAAMNGKPVDYERVLADVRAGRTPVI